MAGLAIASAVAIDAGVGCHFYATRVKSDDLFDDRRWGIYGQQLFFSTRTRAGVTPPWAETFIDSWYRPVWVRQPMGSELAGYTVVTVPFWPLLGFVGGPAMITVLLGQRLRLSRWYFFRRTRPGGFPMDTTDGQHTGSDPVNSACRSTT